HPNSQRAGCEAQLLLGDGRRDFILVAQQLFASELAIAQDHPPYACIRSQINFVSDGNAGRILIKQKQSNPLRSLFLGRKKVEIGVRFDNVDTRIAEQITTGDLPVTRSDALEGSSFVNLIESKTEGEFGVNDFLHVIVLRHQRGNTKRFKWQDRLTKLTLSKTPPHHPHSRSPRRFR